MQKLSNTKIISIVTILLGLVLFAKLIGLALWWYLPSEGVELDTHESYNSRYQRVDFKNMLIRSQTTQVKRTTKSGYSIDNLILKGLYGSRFHGFAIVARKSAPTRTKIIEVGEVYKGYKLKEIEFQRVIFSKNGKKYILELEKSKLNKFDSMVQSVNTFNDEPKKIEKKDINFYTKNPKNLWDEIGLDEQFKAGKLIGFKVTKVKKGSKIEGLGLKKGDLLIRANNLELNSLKNVTNIYKDLLTIDAVNIVLLRDNQEMEINYEIN